MKLTPPEISSAAWKRIKAYIESELARHRAQLESDKGEMQTARLRGQIAALKDLLRLEEASVTPITESTDHLYPR